MKQTFLIFVTLFITVCSAFSQAKEKRLPFEMVSGVAGCDTIYTLPDKKAAFKGGISEMYDFFYQNLKNSDKLTDFNPNRRLVLRLTVDKKGKVAACDVVVSMSSEFDKDAKSVVEKFPDLVPATVKRRYVCSYLIIPLSFK